MHNMTIAQARALLEKGEITPTELVQAFLNRTQQVEPQVKAFITLAEEEALQSAQRIESNWDAYSHKSLAGIPGAIKDNISTANIRTTCASKMLESYIPPYDATVVKKLKDEDSVIIGKSNLDQFAMGSSTEYSYFGASRNPWGLDRVPGGSSGGSAAAVAAGQALYALGSDTGGSIRQPAAFCGVVGMRPTYGVVSRYGVIAFASSLDQVGPITRDVTDCATVLEAISGYDSNDATSYPNQNNEYANALHTDVQGLRIGIPKEYFDVDGVEDGVRKSIMEAIQVMKNAGAEVVEISLPHTEYALPVYYIIAPAEASSNLARFDGIRYGYRHEGSKGLDELYKLSRSEGFGPEVKRRIMLGTYTLSAGYYDAYYSKAQKVRTLLIEDFTKAFANVDVIFTPTAPTIAFKSGDKMSDPYAMYLADIFTIPAAMAGLPCISIPCGFSDGLPVGLQIIGPAFADAKVLQVAYSFEQRTDYHTKRPILTEEVR